MTAPSLSELVRDRFEVLVADLIRELGSERRAMAAMGIDLTYGAQLRRASSRSVGIDAIEKICTSMSLPIAFFTDPTLGPTPDYREFVSEDSGSASASAARALLRERLRLLVVQMIADGVTQQQLAARFGVSQGQISHVANGTNHGGPKLIAAALRFVTDEFLVDPALDGPHYSAFLRGDGVSTALDVVSEYVASEARAGRQVASDHLRQLRAFRDMAHDRLSLRTLASYHLDMVLSAGSTPTAAQRVEELRPPGPRRRRR